MRFDWNPFKRKPPQRDKCACGEWLLKVGTEFHDDSRFRHSRDLCQPRREVIQR